jgi:hypothetical protein
VTPSLGTGTSVSLSNITTNNATPGIYALWVKGQAGSPYLTTKSEPFSINIGNVTRDFGITADAGSKDATNTGDSVSFALSLSNSPNKNTNFGGSVALSVDTPYPVGAGAVTFSSSTVTPSKAGTVTTLTINTGTLSAGEYRFVIRAKGLNGDSPQRSVTHLLPLIVNVAPSSAAGNDEYIDISGFALMRVAQITSNSVTAYAITPVVTDLNDPLLRQGQTARLMPW